jgi:hypothetical protein
MLRHRLEQLNYPWLTALKKLFCANGASPLEFLYQLQKFSLAAAVGSPKVSCT